MVGSSDLDRQMACSTSLSVILRIQETPRILTRWLVRFSGSILQTVPVSQAIHSSATETQIGIRCKGMANGTGLGLPFTPKPKRFGNLKTARVVRNLTKSIGSSLEAITAGTAMDRAAVETALHS